MFYSMLFYIMFITCHLYIILTRTNLIPFLEKYPYLETKISKFKISKKLLIFLILTFFKSIFKNFSTTKINESKILNNRSCSHISYMHSGSKYQIYVPFDTELSSLMKDVSVFLHKPSEEIDITHQPGIPYLMSAASLGGYRIEFIKDNEILYSVEGLEICKTSKLVEILYNLECE